MKPYYAHTGLTIYHGDCREVLPKLGPVDVVLTDPPYGVLEPGDLNLRVRDDKGGRHGLAKELYGSYRDTYQNFCSSVVPALNLAISMAKRAVVFSGPHLQEQMKATAIGGIYCPAGCGRNQWGFKTFLPVLFYGTAPNLQNGAKSITIKSTATSEKNGHPCVKPIQWMRWLVSVASLENETILDPFMGSGTTLLAAKNLGRKAVGIEIEERYCEIAAKRLGQEVFNWPDGVAV